MEATVTFNGPIDVEKEHGATSRLNLNDQRVKIVSEEGNIYWCEPIGFPGKGIINSDILAQPTFLLFVIKIKSILKKPDSTS